MIMKTKGRRVQKQCVISLKFFKELEFLVIRLKPFFWIYFNLGRYHNYPKVKRIAFDFWFEGKEQIYGLSWEKLLEVEENV